MILSSTRLPAPCSQVTATTVGYGDVSVTTQRGRLWAVFHIVLSVCGLADILATNSRITKERSDALAQVAALLSQRTLHFSTLPSHRPALQPHIAHEPTTLPPY
eukprot:scaffold243996_cov40-Tisochrysis_lutea.AAC.3